MLELQRPRSRLDAVKATLLEELRMLDPATLRTQLRDANIEYSALLRSEVGGRGMRMAQPRAQRQRLMALLGNRMLPEPGGDERSLPDAHRRST